MKKLNLNIANCKLHGNLSVNNQNMLEDRNIFSCNLRNTGFSLLNVNDIQELETWYQGSLDIESYLKEYLNILAEKNYIFIYTIVDLIEETIEEFIKAADFKENIIEHTVVEKNRYAIGYKFSNLQLFSDFFESNFNNFVNIGHGLWIGEVPKLNFNNFGHHDYSMLEPVFNIVEFNKVYIELGYDANHLKVFFKYEDDLINFVNQLKKKYEITIEEIEYESCS